MIPIMGGAKSHIVRESVAKKQSSTKPCHHAPGMTTYCIIVACDYEQSIGICGPQMYCYGAK